MNLNKNHLKQPSNPYDAPAWLAFYAANPGFRRSVGAEGVNDDDNVQIETKVKADDSTDVAKAEAEKQKSLGAADDNAKGPSDKEAELLKDVMKQKEARKTAEANLAKLQKQFDGIDVEEYRKIKQDQTEAEAAATKAEEQRMLDRGDFDKVKAQMVELHTVALTEAEEAKQALEKELSDARKSIEELTVGVDFSSSKFISEETVFTPSKARRLYGDHFEIEGGKVIGYDKPRGDETRSPIVDAVGTPVGFDAAMKRIIQMDPEADDIMRASIKPGGNGAPSRGKFEDVKPPLTSREKISTGVVDLMKNIDKPSDGGVSL